MEMLFQETHPRTEKLMPSELQQCLENIANGQQSAIEKLQTHFKTANKSIFNHNLEEEQKIIKEYLERKASEENAYCQFFLGLMYQHGWGVTKDNKKAVEYYKQAAKQGYAEAQISMGTMLELSGDLQNYGESAYWYRQAAETGNAVAQYRLGLLYELGRGVPLIYWEAARWYLQSADANYGWAQYRLGLLLEAGNGLEQNLKEAAAKFWSAAQLGVPDAQFKVALLYEVGKVKDDQEAMRWLQRAAEQNHTEAQYRLGLKYSAAINYQMALKWLSQAAMQNHPAAQNDLGMMYQMGLGVPINYKTANSWFSRSAAQNYPNAQFNLGENYKLGRGEPADRKKAMELYHAAAAQEQGDAMASLGYLYKDQGDHATASYWLLLAVGRVPYGEKIVRDLRVWHNTNPQLAAIQRQARLRIREEFIAKNEQRLQTGEYEAALANINIAISNFNKYVDANGAISGGLLGIMVSELTKGPTQELLAYEARARQGLAERQQRKGYYSKGEMAALKGNYQEALHYLNWGVQVEPNKNIQRHLQRNVAYLTELLEKASNKLGFFVEYSNNFQWGKPEIKPKQFVNYANKASRNFFKMLEEKFPGVFSAEDEFNKKYMQLFCSECELVLLTSQIPLEAVKTLTFFSNEAYVCGKEQLFYVHKLKNEYMIVELSKEANEHIFAHFYSDIGSTPAKRKILSYEELRFITSISGHALSSYKVTKEIDSLKGLAQLYLKCRNYLMAIKLINVAITLYEKANGFNKMGDWSISRYEDPILTKDTLEPITSQLFKKPVNDADYQELIDIAIGIEQEFIGNWLDIPAFNSAIIKDFRTQLAESRKLLLNEALCKDSTINAAEGLRHKKIMQSVTDLYSNLMQQILDNCLLTLGFPPDKCEFAIISLGSMARKEMNLFSDIEIAILIEKVNQQILSYFYKLSQLFIFKLICLGETPTHKRSIIIDGNTYTDSFPVLFSMPLTGLHFDRYAELHFDLLIQTPARLAEYQRKDLRSATNRDIETLALPLRTTAYVAGSINGENLFHIYEECKAKIFRSQIQNSNLFERQKRALELLQYTLDVKKGRERKNNRTMERASADKAIAYELKEDFYRVFSNVISALASYYDLKSQNIWEQLDELYEHRQINQETFAAVKQVMNVICGLRFQIHFAQGEAKEDLYLEEKSLSKEPQQFIVSKKRLESIYQVLSAVCKAARIFLYSEGHDNPFVTLNFPEEDLLEKAQAASFFNDLSTAQEYCENLLLSDPKNIEALCLLADINSKYKKYSQAINYYQQALKYLDQEIAVQKSSDPIDTKILFKQKINLLNDLIEAYRLSENINQALEMLEDYSKANQSGDVNHTLILEIAFLKATLYIDQQNVVQAFTELQSINNYIEKMELIDERDLMHGRYINLFIMAQKILVEKIDAGKELEKIYALLNLSQLLSDMGQFELAESYLKQALSLQQQFFPSTPSVYIAIYEKYATCYLTQDDLSQAMVCGAGIESALKKLPPDTLFNSEAASAYLILAKLHFFAQEYAHALDYALKAKEKITRCKDSRLLIENLYLLGIIAKHVESRTTLFKLQLPNSQTTEEWEEHPVKGGGDSGFLALGSDRRTVASQLLLLKDNPGDREFLAEEIANAFTNYAVTNGQEGLVPNDREIWDKLLEKRDAEQLKFDHLFRKIRTSLTDESARTLNADALITWLQNHQQLKEVEELSNQRLQAFQAERELENYCKQPAVFAYYVNALASTDLRLGYKSALLYAKHTNIALYIWRKESTHSNQLVLIDHHLGSEVVNNQIHMLHTDNFTNFNLLSKPSAKQAEDLATTNEERATDKFKKAEEFLLQALKIIGGNIVADNVSILTNIYHQLFILSLSLAPTESATTKIYFQKINILAQRYQTREYPSVIDLLIRTGEMALNLGELDQCYHLLQQSLSLVEKLFGQESIKAGNVLSLLGELCLKQENLVKAKEYFMRALDNYEKNYSIDNSEPPFSKTISPLDDSFYLAKMRHHREKKQKILDLCNKILSFLNSNDQSDITLKFSILSKLAMHHLYNSTDLNLYLNRMHAICQTDSRFYASYTAILRKVARELPLESNSQAIDYLYDAIDIDKNQLTGLSKAQVIEEQSMDSEKKLNIQKGLLEAYNYLLKAYIVNLRLILSSEHTEFQKNHPLRMMYEYENIPIIQIAKLADETYSGDSLIFAELLESIMLSPFINLDGKSQFTSSTTDTQASSETSYRFFIALFLAIDVNKLISLDGLEIVLKGVADEKLQRAFQNMPTYDICIECGTKALQIKARHYGEDSKALKTLHLYLAALYSKKIGLGDLNAQLQLNFHLERIQKIENSLKPAPVVVTIATSVPEAKAAQENTTSGNVQAQNKEMPTSNKEIPASNTEQDSLVTLGTFGINMYRKAKTSGGNLKTSIQTSLKKSLEDKKPVFFWSTAARPPLLQRIHEYLLNKARKKGADYQDKSEDFIQLITNLHVSCNPETVKDHIKQSKDFRRLSSIRNSEYCNLRDELAKFSEEELEQAMVDFAEYVKQRVEKVGVVDKDNNSASIEATFNQRLFNLLDTNLSTRLEKEK